MTGPVQSPSIPMQRVSRRAVAAPSAGRTRIAGGSARIAGTTAALSVLVTGAVAVLPPLRFAYESPRGHVALETAVGLIAVLASCLVAIRFTETRRRMDLVLAGALLVMGLNALVLYVLPALDGGPPGAFATWSPMGAVVMGAALFAVAPHLRGSPVRDVRRALLTGALLCAAAIALVALLVPLVEDRLPGAVDPALSPASSDVPRFAGHPAVGAVQLVAAILFAVGTVGLVRRADRYGDVLLRWFGVAGVLAVFGRVNYALFPSRYSHWVYLGDFFRLAMCVSLAVAAGWAIAQYQRARIAAAADEERRRVGRDLHDGLSHELLFILKHVRTLARDGTADPRLLSAAERAFDESRRAIRVLSLTARDHEDLGDAVARTAEEVAGREGVAVRLDVRRGIRIAADRTEHVVRIVREAVTNAVRHGRAGEVSVVLTGGDPIRLIVRDDGAGFAPGAGPGGFGLANMRDRTTALDGRIAISAAPGEGVGIEVEFPRGPGG